MIVCNRCGKENQNHYKFCLGCGAELSEAGPQQPAAGAGAAAGGGGGGGGVGMMKTVMADSQQSLAANGGSLPGVSSQGPAAQSPTPPPRVESGGMPPAPSAPSPSVPAGPPPGVAAPPAAAASSDTRACPQCSTDVPPNFRFCGVCGFDLSSLQAAAPAAAQPAPAQAQQPAPAPAPAPAMLTLIRPDGSEGGEHQLTRGENRVGRNHGEIFQNDGYLSPDHAVLTVNETDAMISDQDSLNGVFVRMGGEEEIHPGQIIRIGQELLRFDKIEPPAPLEDGTEVMGSPNPGYWGKITVIIGKDTDGSAYPLLGDSVTLGRERGDINFPDDGYVSGLHARLTQRDGQVFLADMGSSNGTFLRVREDRALGNDSFVLLGQQLFRLNL